MKKAALFISLILLYNFYANATNQSGKCIPLALNFNLKVEFICTKTNFLTGTADTSKFVYAELIYQDSYGAIKQWVNGRYVSAKIYNAIPAFKNLSEALDMLGSEGWELTTSFTRNFSSGFEMYYYFKKKIN